MLIARKKIGFSIVEILTVIGIVAILLTAVLGVSKKLKRQANEQLTASMIEVIVTALEQYYAFWDAFPFEANENYDEDQLLIDLNATLDSGLHEDEYASSEVLYYYLSRTPDCKRIIDSISDTLISNRDVNGAVLLIEIPTGGTETDLIRFVDPWGNAIRYTYATGDSFPVIESAGTDDDFTTTGDNVTSR
jgi:type II secretory pathway pseudopilin PulG